MQEVAWSDSDSNMLAANGAEMTGGRPSTHPGHGVAGARSQDDAMVGYFFQRPSSDVSQEYNAKRWAVGDDSVIEQVRNVNELETDFQNLAFGENRELAPNAKKIWEDDVANKGGGDGKTMFHPGANPWTPRDDAWSNAPSEHAVSHPITLVNRRPGSFPGSDPSTVLSPRSSEAGVLGVNMVEYVLGGSPVGKEFRGMKPFVGGADVQAAKQAQEKNAKAASPFEGEKCVEQEVKDVQSNGIMQNGVEVTDDKFDRTPGSHQNSPTEDDYRGQPQQQLDVHQKLGGAVKDDFLDHHQAQLVQNSGLQLDAPQFEPMGIDPIQFDYSNQLVPPSMDSPNFNMNYNQQQLLQRQQQQQPIAVLTQHQYLATQQQQQLGPTAVVHPQYYSVQATPWGIYPANLLQQPGQPAIAAAGTPQQQQQLLRGQTARPLTPSQQSTDGLATPTGNLAQQATAAAIQAPGPAGYQILAPAYYDQNGQLVVGNGRGIGTPVRLVSPAPILVNAAAGQQVPLAGANGLGANTLRLLTSQQQGGQNQMQANQMAYTSNSSTPQNTGMGDGAWPDGFSSQRRDSLTGSLDYKQRPLQQLNQYYNPLGTASASPAGPMGLVQPGQSLTPPPSLSDSSPSLSLGALGSSSRLYSAAPGAEAKIRNMNSNGFFNINSRLLAKSASLSKEVSGRSRLLEDFRNNRIPNLQLKDLVNHVVEFSQDQHGSRFIQQKLERAAPTEKAVVFQEILTAAYGLMTDVFGNYVIQKFFEFGSSDQKQTLAQRVRGHVLPLGLQMYGCRVIQKALESIPKDMQVEIVKELDGHVLKCVKDQNGNHVIQKCIECVDPGHLHFIIDAFKGQVFALSTHPYGCRVIQRILEHCTPEQTSPILEELHQHTERLVQDQYGNYVIQHVLEHGQAEDKSLIVAELRGKVLVLSQHKFASNVVEKCVAHASRAEKAMLIDEVCSVSDGPHSILYTMMKDQFANYVIQKMIDVAEHTQRKILMHKIRPHVSTLRKYTYGKHILAKLEKFYVKNNADLGAIGVLPSGAFQ